MKDILQELIYKYTGIEDIDCDQNLLKLSIPIQYFLYIILELEDNYHVPIVKIIESESYDKFTINNLTRKLA